MLGASCLLALSLNIFMEAEAEGVKGMEAVAEVTTHRVQSSRYPNDYQAVVLQRKQFSWANGLTRRNTQGLIEFHAKLMQSPKMKNKGSQEAWERAKGVAIRHMVKYHWVHPEKEPEYSHYHTTKVKPKWAKGKKGIKKGNHVFYKHHTIQ